MENKDNKMKKYLLLILIFGSMPLTQAEEVCLEPNKLELLDSSLTAELAILGAEVGFKQTPDYRNLRAKKYNRILTIVENEFPQNYKNIFHRYADNFKILDQMYQQAISKDDRDLMSTIRPIWESNLYIFSDVFPTLLADRALVEFRILSPNKFVAQETREFWSEMPQKELSYRNLKICKEAESNVDLAESLAQLNEKLTNVPYEWALPNPQSIGFSGDFSGEYGAFAREQNEAFISDPESSNIDDILGEETKSVWVWIKNTFDFLNFTKDRTREDEVQKIRDYTSDGLLNRNLDFLENRNRNLDIKRRYMDWRNHRNYWVTKTKDVSGYNTDVLVEKFEIMLDAILQTNAELEDSLRAIEKICKSQHVKIGCWNGSNNLPEHIKTSRESYSTRSVRLRD